jgi:ABC-type lipoprotein export system ATPase subunit
VSLVELVEVTQVRAGQAILQGIDLRMDRGRLVVLAGRSGSGKSTLCHLVAGVMRPTSGAVRVADRPADRVHDWAIVSLLPQRLALAAELTVLENAGLPARLRGRPVDPDLLGRLGLDAIADRPAGATSLGAPQRTALARALVLGPAVAVLDEPTGHQDDEHVDLILDTLTTAAGGGTLVLVATHDQRVIDVADEPVHLSSGRLT